MGENECDYGTSLSYESMKVIAESIGVGNLPDEAAKDLAEDVSYRLKIIIQDAAKFMRHGKRQKLLPHDINRALKIKNIEPILGFHGKEYLPFQSRANNDRVVHFVEQKELDLEDIISKASDASSLKFPLDVTLRAHWLSIDGIQPAILENPPPVSLESQKIIPHTKIELSAVLNAEVKKPKPEIVRKPQKLRNVETVHVKQLAVHELSVEQQLYYQKVTEACMTNDEKLRTSALQSLSVDPGLHEMLARISTFISEGVRVNVVDNNLSFLIYFMRMVKALLDNPSLYLEKYLHELIPAVATCLVAKQLCVRPEIDNHWALRDFAARVMAQICRNFSNSTNNIQTRITGMFKQALTNNQTSLASLYGAIVGLCDLGSEVIKTLVIPNIKLISERIEPSLEGTTSNIDRNAAGHIRSALMKNVIPVLKTIRSPPDYLEEYKHDYGCLGSTLCSAIAKVRVQTLKSAMPTVVNQQRNYGTSHQNSVQNERIQMINQNQSQKHTTVNTGKNLTVHSTPTGQKYVIFPSKSETFSTIQQQEEPHKPHYDHIE